MASLGQRLLPRLRISLSRYPRKGVVLAVGIRIKLPGVTQEQFDAAHDHINPDRSPWPGLLFHSSGPIDGGWGVIDFWESRADFDAHLESDIQPGIAASGGADAGATGHQRVPGPRDHPPLESSTVARAGPPTARPLPYRTQHCSSGAYPGTTSAGEKR